MNSKINTIISSLIILIFILQNSTAQDSATDQQSLLQFKSLVTEDHDGILNSWTTNNTFCNWTGITCDPNQERVVELDLESQGLSGSLSPYIANLSLLEILNLRDNSFVGPVPVEFSRLSQLKILNLADNGLNGTVPSSLSLCTQLERLNLSANQLEGFIPSELSKLPKLISLNLAQNFLTGSIPSSFGNFSSLTNLILHTNFLYGSIPVELGGLQFLRNIQISSNNITGDIPPVLFNLSSLVFFQMADNNLTGSLPSDMFSKFPNLTLLLVGMNKLTGSIPASLSNASLLEEFDISKNNFSGRVPWLGNLANLLRFNVEFNQLVSDGDDGLDFITSLSNASNLEILSIAYNSLAGRLPSIGNLSIHLKELVMGGNRIEGSLPAEIENLVNLTKLGMENNLLSGNIPWTIGNMKKLELITLQGNALTGPIPDSIGNLTALFRLRLDENRLAGSIPSSLANCQRLQNLDLSANGLNGTIPKDIFSIPTLTSIFNLSHNSLSGSLPTEIGKLKTVQGIDLSENQLSGNIPDTIGDCSSLLLLNMAGNSLQGSIPSSISKLTGVETINLSSNNLSGSIPSSLQSLQSLYYLNLSTNRLEGEVPKGGVFMNATAVSLNGNLGLCGEGSGLELPNCSVAEGHSSRSKVKLIIGLSVGGAMFCILLGGFVFMFLCKRKTLLPVTSVVSFEGSPLLYTYYDLRNATDDFSRENLTGEGSFGSVYKGVLPDGSLVAVKVFKMEQAGVLKCFISECEAMRHVRHRNLVRIISACSSNNFKALVLQYMPNGSLEEWLHGTVESKAKKGHLNVIQRLEIAVDVASALEYLHHDCENPVVHCDLKPSNILLDNDRTAHVSDFGLAKLLNRTDNHLNTTFELKGSIGYIPPEYGLQGVISYKGDVYSYGTLLLELFTGKKPTDEMFSGEMTLKNWVEMAIPDQIMDVLDPDIKDGKCAEHLVPVMELGLSCAVESPEGRPTMRDVSVRIKAAKDELIQC